jgi:hypothetical protein
MEYKCRSCREISLLSPKARFCPVCGSSSLVLIVKELTEPTQKETVGVYKTATMKAIAKQKEPLVSGSAFMEIVENDQPSAEKEEEDRPRRRR